MQKFCCIKQRCFLRQGGIAVAVGDSFNGHALPAQRAVMLAVNAVAGQVVLRKDGIHVYAADIFCCAECGGDSNGSAAVVIYAFNRALNGLAARNAGYEHQHSLAVYHALQILAEYHIACGVVFRPQNIDLALRVRLHHARP